MNITQKTIIDDIANLLSKFGRTDDSRLNNSWLGHKINQVRAQLIYQRYKDTEILDQAWFSDLGLVAFEPVNFADDPSVTFCNCDISKAYIPQVLTLPTKSANQDLGLNTVISSCGKTMFYNRPLGEWRRFPKEHIYNKFSFYSRINTAMYVNRKVTSLRIIAILFNPEDGFYKNSMAVGTGSIASGTVYIVKDGQIIYNSLVYEDGETFTGVSGVTTFTGDGAVYLNSQAVAYTETYPYPVSADMARDIVNEICVKEFGIEKSQIADVRNDSKDDAQKG